MALTRTKILVTIGPSTANAETIEAFYREGVAGYRINFVHGDKNTWDEYLRVIEEVYSKYSEYPALIADLPGPQIRIGFFNKFYIKRGSRVKLVYGLETGEEAVIPVDNPRVFELLETGDIVLIDDGRLRFSVENVSSREADLIALSNGYVLPRKTLVVAGKEIPLPVVSQKDIEFIEYVVSRKFTYVALSYVRSKRDVETIREILDRMNGGEIGIIAKIETRKSVENIDSIAESSDTLLVARGDLGMHYGLEKIPLLQRMIVEKALLLNKPVIIATQLLESMVYNTQPTRSEVVDVMNAVFDYVDALLLTDETAIGEHPVEAVKWLRKIVVEAEEWMAREHRVPPTRAYGESVREKYARGLVSLSENLEAKILVYTKTGLLPTKISRYRPYVKVYVGTVREEIARKLQIYYGLKPVLLHGEKDLDYNKGVERLYRELLEKNELEYGDTIVLAYGPRETTLYVIKIVKIV